MSDTANSEILIKILTAYDSGGITAAQKAVQDLKSSVDTTSQSGGTLSGVLEAMSGKGQSAGQIFAGLSTTFKTGGANAQSMTAVVKGLGGALGIAAGPAAALGAAVGLIVSAVQAYKEHREAAAQAAEKAAEREKAAAEKAKKAIEDLDKARVDAARRAVADLKEELDGATNAAKGTRSALDALEDSQLAVEIAGIDAQEKSGALDSDTADYLRTKARAASEDRKDQRALDDLRTEEDRLTAARDQSAEAAAQARQESEAADAALLAAAADLADAERLLSKSVGPIAYNQNLAARNAARERYNTAKDAADAAGTASSTANATAKAAADALSNTLPDIQNRRDILVNNLTARQTTVAAADAAMQARIDAIPKQEADAARTAAKEQGDRDAKTASDRADAQLQLQLKQIEGQLVGEKDPARKLELERKKQELQDTRNIRKADDAIEAQRRKIAALSSDASEAERKNLEDELSTLQLRRQAAAQTADNNTRNYTLQRQSLADAQAPAAPEEKPLKDLSPSERLARNKAKRQDKRAPASESPASETTPAESAPSTKPSKKSLSKPASSAPAQSAQTAEAATTAAPAAAAAANETVVADLSAALDRLPEAVPDLSGLSASITAADAAAQSAASSNAQTLSSLSSSLQSLSTLVVNLSSLTSKIQTLTSNINSAATRISNAFQTATGVIEHLTNVFPDFDNLINAVKKLDKRVDKLEHDLSRID